MKNLTLETIKRFASVLEVETWQFFASPEEVSPKKDTLSITCPYCGKDINIKVRATASKLEVVISHR